MTINERIEKMDILRAEVDELTKTWNAITGGDEIEIPEGKDILAYKKEIEDDTDQKVNEYTSHAKAICFQQCADAADPMIEACTRLTYETIYCKDTEDKEAGTTIRTVEPKQKAIDLQQLHKFVTGGIGHDKQWLNIAEQFNFLLTAQAARDLGIDPKEINDSYEMADISKAIDLGKNPTSKTNLLRTLQAAITAMIGPDYKAVSHDVNYLLKIYTKRSSKKALHVAVANHRYFRTYLMDVCHRLITGKTYGVEYKAKKESK